MNKSTLFTFIAATATALIVGLVTGGWWFSSSKTSDSALSQHTHSHTTNGAANETPAKPEVWTCSMHPQIQQYEPGDCPICGMDLILLETDSSGDEGPRELSMSESSKALAGIQTTEVLRTFPEAEIRLVGKLTYDETREKSLTARFPARIDQLYVNFTGIRVKAGEHLASVYSPDLLTAQRELLSAYRSDPEGSITQAAREKLRLWDLLPDQIDAILEKGEASDHFTLKAPVGGIVVEKNVKEGDYVKTGEPLFKIVDLSVLWASLDAYESDLPWLRFGQEVTFSVQAVPGETFHGSIVFLNPEVNPKTRTIPVRVNVPNTDGHLKPGMFVRAVVKSRIAEDGSVYAPEFSGKWISPMHPEIVKDHPGICDVCGMDLVPAEELGYANNEGQGDVKPPLVIPTSAVLRTGKRAVVYLEKPNSERPTFEGREIVLGPRAGDSFLVVSGLEAGDRIVTQGAFKIDSALQIQAKPSMMNPSEEETAPHSDHEHIAMEDSNGADINLNPTTVHQLLPGYFQLQSALAADDLHASKQALRALTEVTGDHGALPDLIHLMLSTGDLDALRRPHFEKLSNALIDAIKTQPQGIETSVYLMHCPMVYPDRGADWLQPTDDLRNPYFGSMMLTCGEVKGEITSLNANEE